MFCVFLYFCVCFYRRVFVAVKTSKYKINMIHFSWRFSFLFSDL